MPPTSPAVRWSGAAAVATLWTTVATGMALTGLGLLGERPISYLGTDERTVLLFRSGLVAAAALVAAFSFYARAVFAAPLSFLVAALLGLVGQVVLAIIPLSGPGASPAVHTAGGLALGISLPVLMWRFATGLPTGPWRTTAYRLFWLEAAACVAVFLLSRAGRATVAEILPALAFHLWIAVVTARSAAPASDRSARSFSRVG